MTPPPTSAGPGRPPRRHAPDTGRSPSGAGPPWAGVAPTDVALLSIYIFIVVIGVTGSIFSSGAVHAGFSIVAAFVGFMAYFRITSIIIEKISRSSWRRGSQGLSGTAEQEPGGPSWDEVLAEISLLARTGWRLMRAAAWLMPRAAGTRWLAEASSVLQEAPPAQWSRVVLSYLCTAPEVIVRTWACYLARRIRPS
jgi:hypothetical protein